MLSFQKSHVQENQWLLKGLLQVWLKKIVGCRFADRCTLARPECKKNNQNIRMVGDREVRCEYAQ
jgi:peptide/nickel transport system ATP-binding protein